MLYSRNISERSLVCENPPRRFIFAQMTVGLEECYERTRNKNGNERVKNEAIDEEEFLPVPGCKYLHITRNSRDH